ncbi:MAG: hypothetical protein AAF492_15270, partial [Verrucomicrobiota bacterium]
DQIIEVIGEVYSNLYWLKNGSTNLWQNQNNLEANVSLQLGKAYWYNRTNSSTFAWVEHRPYLDLFPPNDNPPLVTNMVLNEAKDAMTLQIQTLGTAGESLDIFYKDIDTNGSFTADTSWNVAELDLPVTGTTDFVWTDDGSNGRGPVDSVFARFYLVGRADIDTDGDGLPDARERFIHRTSPTSTDSDGDMFSDDFEIQAGTDPTSFDGFHVSVDFCGYTKVDPLTNFPVLVELDPAKITGFDYADFLSPDGHDLRVWNISKNQELNYEIDTWDTNGISYIWVQIPLLFFNDYHVWVTWGIDPWTNQPAYTTNGATWSEKYVGVWHMHDTDPKDASGQGNDGVGQNVGTNSGFVGQGIQFDANDNSIVRVTQNHKLPILHHATNRQFTFEGWVKGPKQHSHRYFSMGNSTNDTMHYGYITGGYSGRGRIYIKNDNGVILNNQYGNKIAFNNDWKYLAWVDDDGALDFFVDGELDSTDFDYNRTNLTVNNTTFGALQRINNSHEINATLDEFRISEGKRSTNWLHTTWMNMASIDTFLCFGDVLTNVPAVAVDNLNGPDQITGDSAGLHGRLTIGLDTDVYIFWGDNDGQETIANWDSFFEFPAQYATSLVSTTA